MAMNSMRCASKLVALSFVPEYHRHVSHEYRTANRPEHSSPIHAAAVVRFELFASTPTLVIRHTAYREKQSRISMPWQKPVAASSDT